MNPVLEALRRNPAFWGSGERPEVISTGNEALDALLPDGGWPFGRLTEVFAAREGIGELRLLMPALARLSSEGKWVAWVGPPHLPYGPALAAGGVNLSRFCMVRAKSPRENLWAAEQILASGSCGAVVSWVSEHEVRIFRRLQLAAEKGRGLGILFRPFADAPLPSPATLRLAVEGRWTSTVVRVLKGGGAAGRSARLVPDVAQRGREPSSDSGGDGRPEPAHGQ